LLDSKELQVASNYTGNPSAVQTPSLAPGPGIVPVVSLIQDADGNTAANLYQAWKVPVDDVAYLMNGHFSSFMQENFMMAGASYSSSQNPLTNYAMLRVLVNGAAWTAQVGGGKATVSGAATVSGDYCYVACPSSINTTSLGNSSQYAIEFDIIENGPSIATAVTRIGLGDNVQLDAATNYAYVQTTPSASTWTLNVNGTTSVLSAGFNPPGTSQRIRLVGFGSATATGVANGAAITKVYINDVFATSVNACATTALFPSLGIKATGNATGQAVQCNCITTRWNRF
jgi:hypothetical protein